MNATKSGRSSFLLNIAALAVILFLPMNVSACECAEKGDLNIKKWFTTTSETIFAGEVINISELEIPDPGHPNSYTKEQQVTFRVMKGWKNVKGDKLTIRNLPGCEYLFKMGEKYFVSAELVQGQMTTSLCNQVQKYATAGKIIRQLDKLSNKQASLK